MYIIKRTAASTLNKSQPTCSTKVNQKVSVRKNSIKVNRPPSQYMSLQKIIQNDIRTINGTYDQKLQNQRHGLFSQAKGVSVCFVLQTSLNHLLRTARTRLSELERLYLSMSLTYTAPYIPISLRPYQLVTLNLPHLDDCSCRSTMCL